MSLFLLAVVTLGLEWPSSPGSGAVGGEPPAFIQEAKLVGQGTAFIAQVGNSVSVSGDTAVLGAPREGPPGSSSTGSAYVFVRSGTLWSLEQRLTASDGQAGDYFGYSVSVSGDTAVVGSPFARAGVHGSAGAAYVFVRSGTVWVEQQKLVAPDAAPGDFFGTSVSLAADTVVVGAPYREELGPFSRVGAVYVFTRSGAVWSPQQKLTASDAGVNRFFGASVSLSGDTALIGSPANYLGSGPGAAYVVVRSGTTWSEQQKLSASDGQAADEFGAAVSVSGDTALVGAWRHDTPFAEGGAAYVFSRSGTAWSEQQKLSASDAAAGDNLGRSVDVSGDRAIVGASGTDGPGTTLGGSAYAFVRSGTTWTQREELVPADQPVNAQFGFSAAVSGDTIVIGAPFDGGSQGSAYVFREVQPTDLAVSQSDSPDPVAGLQTVTYTIVVANLGPRPAYSLSVTDTLPAGANLLSAGGTGWSCTEAAGVVTCTRPNLAVGVAPALSVTVRAPAVAGSITNNATVAHVGTDPVPANNSASETTAVTLTPAADLSVTKSDGGAQVRWGQPFTWTITVANAGPDPATSAGVADTFPAEVTAVGWTCTASSGSSCPASGGGDITAAVSLLAGGTATFTATGTVTVGTASLTNTATVTPPSGVYDATPADNSSSVTASAGPFGFHALTPCRVIDTRISGPALAANSTRTFAVGGLCQVPADAQAVAAMLIAVNPGDPGDLRLYPAGLPAPQASTLNFAAGRTRANNAVVPLGMAGQIQVQCDMPPGSTASTHFVLDVVGYFR